MRKRATDPGKMKSDEGDAYKFKARLAGLGKGSREAPISLIELGTAAQGSRAQDLPKLWAPAALGGDLPIGSLGTNTDFSLKARTSRQSPQIQWGWTHFYSKLPQYVPSSLKDIG